MAGNTVKLGIGGDFDQWWKDVLPWLRDKGLVDYCLVKTSRLSGTQRARKQEAHIDASVTMCSHVTATLLLRVPLEDRFHPRKLRDHFCKSSKPFRITDLPSELRARVYESYFDEVGSGSLVVLESEYWYDAGAHSLPPWTRTSRQVRTESIHSLVTSKPLFISLPHCENKDAALKINESVRDWAALSAKAYIRHIRNVEVCIYPNSSAILTFTEKDGLEITFDDGYQRHTAEHQERLVKYVSTVEEDRKALSLKGESIILAMIKDPFVWIYDFGNES